MADRLSNAEFFTRLSDLFAKSNEGASSVFLVQKRLSYDPERSTTGDLSDLATVPSIESTQSDKRFQLLIRATDGKSAKKTGKQKAAGEKKTKFSTVVDSDKLAEFWNEYAQVVRSGMSCLQKKAKKKVKKTKQNKITKP